MNNPAEHVTAAEFARIAGLSRSTPGRWAQQGRVADCYLIGGTYMAPFEAWQAARPARGRRPKKGGLRDVGSGRC